MFIGWMGFRTNQPALWTKEVVRGTLFYSNGFSVTRPVYLSAYTNPPTGQSLLSWTNGYAVIGEGNLGGLYTNAITLAGGQVRVLGGSISNLNLSLSTGNGQFSGSFVHPRTGQTTPLKGALAQGELDGGYGWFLGTNQGGFIRLLPRD